MGGHPSPRFWAGLLAARPCRDVCPARTGLRYCILRNENIATGNRSSYRVAVGQVHVAFLPALPFRSQSELTDGGSRLKKDERYTPYLSKNGSSRREGGEASRNQIRDHHKIPGGRERSEHVPLYSLSLPVRSLFVTGPYKSFPKY